MGKGHIPVLLEAVVELLDPATDATILDATGGGGGMAEALAHRLGPRGRLVVLDRDRDAVARIEARLEGVAPVVQCFQENFRNLDRVLEAAGLQSVDGLLADLGLSSFQIEDPGRGFSYQTPGPLDMRYDQTQPETADHWVNHVGQDQLARIIHEYGEERYSRRIAGAIVRARPIQDTITLAEVVRRAVPRGSPKKDRAMRTFQALRIAVNLELTALEEFLDRGLEALSPGGRMAVISFHSLETRRVKTAFRGAVKAGRVSLLTPKPIRPPKAEVRHNPRSRSAILRCVERIA